MGAQIAFSELASRPAKIAQPAVVVQARPRATMCVLLAADVLAILVARAVVIRPSVGWVSLGLLVLTYAALGLYSPGQSAVEELRRSVLGTGFVCLLLAVRGGPDPPGLLILSGCLTAAAVPFVRSITRNVLASRPWWGVPVIVLGAGPAAKRLIERLRKQPEVGFKPVACFDDDHQGECAGLPVYNWMPGAGVLAKTLGIHHALVAMPELAGEELAWALDEWGTAFRHVILVPDLMGVASLWVSAHDIAGMLGLGMRQNLLIPLHRWTKRALDIGGALALGTVSLPVLAAAAVWIKWASRGSVFYRHEREGQYGRPIRIPKLRTMHPDAEALLMRALLESAEMRAEWSSRFKLRQDPRILPGVGRLLRRTSLDELPQLWSVFKGEMSLVGPRPFPTYHLDGFGERFQTLRAQVKPGLTGLWQVSDRADGDLAVQETLDTYYIRNWSLWLDLYILARTVRAVLFPKGAY
ncbi:MAG TPA: exopolysaccharide biosynthesis polyprenyl glycosylphosphotransferase [Bryobacteraceae bacterium]|nr:exopolysaccharide biosynthesis polyprenyl glycosylphosphotransferase [Bryobacteraceae bacterium]